MGVKNGRQVDLTPSSDPRETAPNRGVPAEHVFLDRFFKIVFGSFVDSFQTFPDRFYPFANQDLNPYLRWETVKKRSKTDDRLISLPPQRNCSQTLQPNTLEPALLLFFVFGHLFHRHKLNCYFVNEKN